MHAARASDPSSPHWSPRILAPSIATTPAVTTSTDMRACLTRAFPPSWVGLQASGAYPQLHEVPLEPIGKVGGSIPERPAVHWWRGGYLPKATKVLQIEAILPQGHPDRSSTSRLDAGT
jgi:hypothetical protein